MIFDLNKDDVKKEYDICIVGTGPAGIVLVNELAKTGKKICILESGGIKKSAKTDALRETKSDGIKIKTYSRERVFGGASKTWAGLSSLYDSDDFNSKQWSKYLSWPISYEELLPYYKKAVTYKFPNINLFSTKSVLSKKIANQTQLFFHNDSLQDKMFISSASPKRFAEYYDIFVNSDDVDLFLHATVGEIRKDKNNSTSSDGVVVYKSNGDKRFISARKIIIAAGGIDNAVILLNSKSFGLQGLGNGHDVVGRFLMNHPKSNCGIIELHTPIKKAPYYFGAMIDGYAAYAGIQLTKTFREEKQLLNSYLRLEPMFPWSDSKGVESLITIITNSKVIFSNWKKLNKNKLVYLRDYSETGDDSGIKNNHRSVKGFVKLLFYITSDISMVGQYVFYRLFSKLNPSISKVRIRNFMEMEPEWSNRITLSEEVNGLSIPVPIVAHSVTKKDKESMIVLHKVLFDTVSSSNIGVFKSPLLDNSILGKDWPINQDASHYIGTTRMGDNPETSVVDGNCRIHGINNVYVAGSSIFATSGCVNPTLTIAALAIRLAKHLK